MKKFLAFMLVFAVALSGAFAQAKKVVKPDYTIKLAYYDAATWPNGTAPAPLPEHAFALVFKSIVESNTNGKVAVELFPGNALGDTKATMEMARTGSIEMVITTGTAASLYPQLQVIFLPYVFKSDEIAWWFFDNSPFWKNMVADFEKKTGMIMCIPNLLDLRHSME